MLKQFAATVLAVFILSVDASAMSARSAVLIDGQLGRVIYEKNAYARLPMASTTKIMSAVVALQMGKLTDIVTVGGAPALIEGSSMYLIPGEKISLEDLLYGLMLESGNDAAVAIAEHIGGSQEKFVELMNRTALDIGLKNTHFCNPHGLHDEEHYTTAFELAQLMRYAHTLPQFSQITATRRRRLVRSGREQVLTNHNRMLNMYEGADGGKTGFTKKSGRTLVSSATRDGMRLIAVTLNAPNDWSDHAYMFDYGFENYRNEYFLRRNDYVRTIAVKGGEERTVGCIASDDLYIALEKGRRDGVAVSYDFIEMASAPVLTGGKLGTASLTYNGTIVQSIDLVADRNVSEIVGRRRIWEYIKALFGRIFRAN